MRIENEIELDYSDVLIKPRRSTIASRKDADITREYKFKWSGKVVKGTGIMQANMGTIGNFEVSRKMLNAGLFACLHKHHNVEDLIEFYRTLVDEHDTYLRCLLAVGLKDNGVEKVREIKRALGITVSVRLDVPNGYIPQIKQLVIDMRAEFPDMIIFVGNVVTGDITEDLILNGADAVVCGIGGGSNCILGGTKVKTIDGYKKMRDICEGDLVQTHTGEYHKVLTKLCYNYHYEKININGIECTPEHKLYVVNKKDIDNITEDNYTEFAYWVEACNLDEETQMLIEIK